MHLTGATAFLTPISISHVILSIYLGFSIVYSLLISYEGNV